MTSVTKKIPGPGDNGELSMNDVRDLVDELGPEYGCGQKLHGADLDFYEHSGGWNVTDYTTPVWLFLHCRSCERDTALWKVGVDQDFSLDHRSKRRSR